MSDLSQLLSDEKRPAVASDLAAFVESQISEQSGITGMAIKGAAAAARKVDSNIVPKGVNRMLPDLLGDLDPHWQAFQADASTDFGEFLAGRSPQVVDALMSVADRNAEQISIPALAKAYNSLRGKGAKLITPAVPELGRILQRNMD
ncbi:DUF6918 family protein [Corynebacterium halotolerans]|uniref:Uncharacterized protein n=1 Tax=Corynebacterium halotolerans YIM 70093 = DSM 44683 TaxID=1121362 RepID=M1MTL3_9CORY|nr:hypothetical protein [Corynebacterium halotolerans]AGF71024.1 hypothetical protein A605_00030 [Corynebacterium halotolerans YIM 70093 = DSM 44683]